MTISPTTARRPCCVGRWLPSDQTVLNAWLVKINKKAMRQTGLLLPAVEQLKILIENDPLMDQLVGDKVYQDFFYAFNYYALVSAGAGACG